VFKTITLRGQLFGKAELTVGFFFSATDYVRFRFTGFDPLLKLDVLKVLMPVRVPGGLNNRKLLGPSQGIFFTQIKMPYTVT